MTATLLGRALVAAMMMLGATVTSAAAETDRAPSSFVTLSVRDDHNGAIRTTTLACHPTGGTHPQATGACASLTAARGEFGSLQPQTSQCPLIFKPVTVGANGTWRDEPLRYTKTFSNSCSATAQTEGVFDF